MGLNTHRVAAHLLTNATRLAVDLPEGRSVVTKAMRFPVAANAHRPRVQARVYFSQPGGSAGTVYIHTGVCVELAQGVVYGECRNGVWEVTVYRYLCVDNLGSGLRFLLADDIEALWSRVRFVVRAAPADYDPYEAQLGAVSLADYAVQIDEQLSQPLNFAPGVWAYLKRAIFNIYDPVTDCTREVCRFLDYCCERDGKERGHHGRAITALVQRGLLRRGCVLYAALYAGTQTAGTDRPTAIVG